MEDFCQLAGRLPGDKYTGSAELCARLLKTYSAQPPVDLARFFRRLLFCWWSGNGDAHLKNFSLLTRERGEPRLSPAYDLVNTRVLIPDDPFALPVGGKQRNIGSDVWKEFVKYCELPPAVAVLEARRLLKQEGRLHEMVHRSWLDQGMKEAYASVLRARRAVIAALAA